MWATRGRQIEIDVLRGYFRPGPELSSANSPYLPDSRCRPYSNTEFVNCTFYPGYEVDKNRAIVTSQIVKADTRSSRVRHYNTSRV